MSRSREQLVRLMGTVRERTRGTTGVDEEIARLRGGGDPWQFGEVLDLHVTEEPVRARDIECGQEVRPAGWHGYLPTLGAEPLPYGCVRVLWRCDAGDDPPGPFTIFAADEWLAVAR